MKGKRGFTLVELLVVIVIIGVLAALLLPAIARAIRNGKVTRCINGQTQLWKMMANYCVQFGGGDKLYPPATGGAFWTALSATTPPLIDIISLPQIYGCPVKGVYPPPGSTDFRGPGGNVNAFKDGDPVGADKDGNHTPDTGGNVVRMSYDCITVDGADPLWTLCATKLTN